MSKETWIKEFYPVEAGKVSAGEAIKHSLQKWYGLREENLRRHGLSEPPINVDSSDCALCRHYIKAKCLACPLKEFLSAPCCSGIDNAYYKYTFESRPEPMIAALEAISFVEDTCK